MLELHRTTVTDSFNDGLSLALSIRHVRKLRVSTQHTQIRQISFFEDMRGDLTKSHEMLTSFSNKLFTFRCQLFGLPINSNQSRTIIEKMVLRFSLACPLQILYEVSTSGQALQAQYHQ
jgi:hypothetical protein